MSDFPALVHFYDGWADHHEVSSDGFPVFQHTVMIQIERPPLLKLNREAHQDDFLNYPEEYAVFKTINKGRDTGVAEQGYPLVMWPVLTPADIQVFAARGIYTVEELAKLANRRDMPAPLVELALRAERMMDMQQNFGKYDILLAERDAQLKEVVEQLKEARATISAQNAMIDTLKMRVA